MPLCENCLWELLLQAIKLPNCNMKTCTNPFPAVFVPVNDDWKYEKWTNHDILPTHEVVDKQDTKDEIDSESLQNFIMSYMPITCQCQNMVYRGQVVCLFPLPYRCTNFWFYLPNSVNRLHHLQYRLRNLLSLFPVLILNLSKKFHGFHFPTNPQKTVPTVTELIFF